MKVQFKGKFDKPAKMDRAMSVVLSDLFDRLGVPEGAEMAIEDLQFKVVLTIDGQEQYVSVPREVEGETIHEIFTVEVQLDENGHVVKKVDNEEESFFDGFTMAQALGKEYKYEVIESGYNDADLEEVGSINPEGTDVRGIRYKLLTEEGTEIFRYYKADNLVFEEEIKSKDLYGSVEELGKLGIEINE